MSLIRRGPLLRGKVTKAGQRVAETHETQFECLRDGDDVLLRSLSGREDSYGSLIALRFEHADLLEILKEAA